MQPWCSSQLGFQNSGICNTICDDRKWMQRMAIGDQRHNTAIPLCEGATVHHSPPLRAAGRGEISTLGSEAMPSWPSPT